MSLWRSIGGLFGRAARSTRAAVFAGGHLQPVSVEAAKQNATVYAALQLISNTVAKLPLQAPRNPQINRVLQAPNPLQTGATFHSDIVADVLLYGNALVEIKRGATGSILGLLPISPAPPPQIEAVGGEIRYTISDGTVYRNLRSGGTRHYELVHVRDIGGGHEPWSQSRISGAGTALRALLEADKLISTTFMNGPSVSYFIRTPAGKLLGAEEQEALERQMRQFTQTTTADGRPQRGGYAYIGGLEVAPVKGLTPADADLRDLRSDLKLEIAAVFGVPPFRAGGDANTKYSNATAANAALVRDEILSLVANTTATFSEALGIEITCDTAALLKGDLMDQIKAAVMARGGPVLDLDEARELVDAEPATAAQREELTPKPEPAPEPDMRDRDGERRDIPEEDQ